MIHIISGANNQGKTAKIKSVYDAEKKGDGYISEKIIRNSIFCGYNITRLTTGESAPLAIKTEFFPIAYEPLYTKGSFSFYEDAIIFACSIIDDIILKKVSPVFIDEIGPLELEGKGVHDSFKKLLETGSDIYFTVRKHSLEKAITLFRIKDYSLIDT